MADQAFVTLATTDSYARGAMVLGKSLRNHNTSKKLVVLIGPNVSEPCQSALRSIYDDVRVVDVLDSGDTAHLALLQRPELGVTLTKLHCWTLTQFSKCVFMDADTLVLSNIDELFDREELSAAPDPGWPDCFNSGVFVFRPSVETYGKLLQYCTEKGSFDGGDQGVLNGFFSNWATADISKHLPFIYNLSSIAIYTYLPAFKQFGSSAKVVHFLGQTKPWSYTFDPQTKQISGGVKDAPTHPAFLLDWWTLYASTVVPVLQEKHGDEPFVSGCLESQESNSTVTTETVQKGFQESRTTVTTETVQKGSQEIMQKGSQEIIQKGSQEIIQKGSQESDTTVTTEIVQKGSQEIIQKGSQESDTTVTTETVQKGSQEIIQKGSQESDTTVTTETIQKGSQESDKTVTTETVQGESSMSHASVEPEMSSEMSSERRKEQWEQGQADYMGMDSFDNIKRKLDTFLK